MSDIAADRAALAQLADDRSLVEQLNAVISDVESKRTSAINLLGQGHPSEQPVNGAASAAGSALSAAHEAVERFLQEILNAAGASG